MPMRPAAESFEAQTIVMMRKAHEFAWARLLTTGIVGEQNLRRMQKLTAQHAIEMAAKGERDVWRLARKIIFHTCAVVAQERLKAASASAQGTPGPGRSALASRGGLKSRVAQNSEKSKTMPFNEHSLDEVLRDCPL